MKETKLKQLLEKLDEKYDAMGQDMESYLEGLLYSNFTPYWDYIQLDTLLSLQKPRTSYKDELIFIAYHQVTELYFKMILHELNQLADLENVTYQDMVLRVPRINRYFDCLTDSFGVMSEGMEREQFMKFRMALLPASGFQSAQYRKIEFLATDLVHLVHKDFRNSLAGNESIEELYAQIYWKKGATELASGKKTLTLRQFEENYDTEFIKLALKHKNNNLWKWYKNLSEREQNDEKLLNIMQALDLNVNVNWPLAHYKTAAKYLAKDDKEVEATGGTNWKKYLPPNFQQRIFFPSLWSQNEIEDWGKTWVRKFMN